MSSDYEQRIAALERRVALLEARGAQPLMRRGSPAAPPPPAPVTAAGNAAPGSVAAAGDDWFRRGEGWLGRAGVALVLLGMIFLFRYAVDRGWLTPELRIATGLLVGGGMLGAGLRIVTDRLRYRQILMGGGILVLFITGLAASELYGLISGAVALLFHGAVAVAAFTIAARQRDTVMASIAAVGSLVPPAVLLHDAVAGPVLWLYLLLMAAWAALLAARHEPGPFALLAPAAAVLAMLRVVPADSATRGTALAAVTSVWLGFAALPLLRSRLSWAKPLPAGDDRAVGLRLLQPLLVTAMLAAVLNEYVWPGAHAFEAGMAAAAAGFAALAAYLYRFRAGELTREAAAPARPPAGVLAHTLTASDDFAAAAMATAACVAFFCLAALDPAVRFLAVAAVATVSYLAAFSLRAPLLGLLAHSLHAAVLIAFINRIETMLAAPAFDTMAMAFAAVVPLAAVMVWRTRTDAERLAYGAGIYVLVHVLLATELGAVPGAPWLASVSYALAGSALVLLGLSRQQLRLQQAGLLSLALLVLRLFAYDLARVDTGVRILLFLACGFAFLGLSYVFRGRNATT